MKMVVLLLLLAVSAAQTVLADPCSGTELGQVSTELAHDAPRAAQQLLDPIAASHPDCPAVLLAQARIEAATGQDSQAAYHFERYLQLQPEDANGYAYFARFLLDRNEYQRADDISSTAIQKDPNAPAALAVRGQILDMKGSAQPGMELLSRSCQLDPEDVRAQFDLGSMDDRAKRPGDAVAHFQKVVSLEPGDPRAWDYLALNLEPLGEIDAAKDAYAKGLAVNQQGPHFDAFLDYNYGRLLMKLDRLSDSKIHLDRAVELVPQMRATWYERAKLDLRLKDYPRARTDAEKAAAIPDPNGIIIDLQIYALLEQVYRRLGEAELAAKYAELGRQTAPPVRGEHH
ncbi:MAG: tetratricopeptide repeat protein [Acidobacteriaceae bacterium]